MGWDHVDGGIESIHGPREREPAGRRTAGGAGGARAFDELGSGVERAGLEEPQGARHLSKGGRQTPESQLVLSPLGAGRFGNAQQSISLRMQQDGAVQLTLRGRDGADLALHGMRSGGHLYLAGAETPVLRAEIVPLDESGRFTLVGFESLMSASPEERAAPLGVLFDPRSHSFRTPGSQVTGRWDPDTHELHVRLNDEDGAPVLETMGLYGKGTAVVRVPEGRVLGLTYDLADAADSEAGADSFMWVHGALPLVPPLGGIWDSLQEPLIDDLPSTEGSTPDERRPRDPTEVDAAMQAAGVLPQGDPVLTWRRVAPALDSLPRRLRALGEAGHGSRDDGLSAPRLFDSTA